MPACARREIVRDGEVGFYHVYNRCVRRAFLCGEDELTGKNYDRRREWIADTQRQLARLFAVNLSWHAELSNHFHVVLRSRPDVVACWSDTEVAHRWLTLCPIRKTSEGQPETPTEAELDTIRGEPQRLAEIRRRLSDISWWMRMAAEPMARRANAEDETTGRFWEGRYKSVKLCDEAALLACLVYVDLNPIRAGLALSPEDSNYTSVQCRIEALLGQGEQDAWLAPLEIDESQQGPLPASTDRRASDKGCLPISLADYLQLVDWTGRRIKCNKLGSIPAELAPILERIGIAQHNWLPVVKDFGRYFRRVAGATPSVARQRPRTGRQRSFHPGRAELLSAA